MKKQGWMLVNSVIGDLVKLPNGKLSKLKANYTLTTKDAKSIYKLMTELKMLDGYASNFSRCANVDKRILYGMK